MAKEKIKKPIYKRWWAWLIAIIIVIIIIANIGGGSDDSNKKASDTIKTPKIKTTASTPAPKPAPKPKEKIVAVGQPATVGDVSFTVNKVQAVSSISSGNQFIDDAKAQGQFIILDITVKNAKKKSISITQDFFKIESDDGTTYDTSDDADVFTILTSKKTLFTFDKINPGNSQSGQVVFDVPKDLDLSKAHLTAQTGLFGTEKVKLNLK